MSLLKKQEVSFLMEQFETKIPSFRGASLIADGKSIKAEPCALVGGVLSSKSNIISSLISSQKFINDDNINFNPACRAISRSNYYFAPSLAVNRRDIYRISRAKKIRGIITVRPVRHISLNVAVGNIRNPRFLIFTHYDSIGPGALDNASGVAVLINLLEKRPETLKNSLYIFSGNEEISYDYPIYWGHGYRAFEKNHPKLLKAVKAIYVVDCVGNGPPLIERNLVIAKLAFPINNLNKLGNKIFPVSGNIQKLMEVYHSSLDTPEKLSEGHLCNTVKTLYGLLK